MEIRSHSRLSGSERVKVATQMARDYNKGLSVRDLASKYGTSLGRVRRLLIDAEIEFRPRGGRHT